MTVGIGHQNMDPTGFTGLVRETIHWPIAQDADYFTSATSGGAQGAFSIATSAVGDSVFLSAEAAKPLYYGRRPQATMTDASGTTLRVTVRITGKRFGRPVVQDIACVTSGTAVSGTRVIDEVTSIKIISMTANAGSDELVVGLDSEWLGLRQPIKSKNDINMVYKVSTVTPDTAGPKTKSDITAAMVNVVDSAIDFKALYSAVIAVTHTYLVEYFSAGGPASMLRVGKRLG